MIRAIFIAQKGRPALIPANGKYCDRFKLWVRFTASKKCVVSSAKWLWTVACSRYFSVPGIPNPF